LYAFERQAPLHADVLVVVTARGVFTAVTDLRRKLMRYIKQDNKTAKPIRWAYADPTRRVA
jgi:hypothetical protein